MTYDSDSMNNPSDLELTADDKLAENIESFICGLNERVERIVEAAGRRDFHLLCTLAHRLKGSAGSCGYPIVTQKAAVLEHHAALAEIDAVDNDLEELKMAVHRVVMPV